MAISIIFRSGIVTLQIPAHELREFHSVSADRLASESLNRTPPWSSKVLDHETNEDFRESEPWFLPQYVCCPHRVRRTDLPDSGLTNSPV